MAITLDNKGELTTNHLIKMKAEEAEKSRIIAEINQRIAHQATCWQILCERIGHKEAYKLIEGK